ncbi:hypothetical protein SCHPADRAFT_905811 [Schizopora paradoxa]|uniref:DUF6533 domain-containing protein n=1 Tax=Schizopora paradoxa TaxID=27342 RepID=A0A0H2RIS6_9AGAM|nr:hypothetical protein SCHPADRAFT_905811 [Schizopora paradoxa]
MDFLSDAARNLQIVRYTIVATTCLVAYEYCINFDNEVQYLWRKRLGFGGFLLFLCRYLPIASAFEGLYAYVTTTDLKDSHCMLGYSVNAYLVYVEFLLSVLVLFTRAYAVWNSRVILVVLTLVYTGGIAGTSYAIHLFMKGVSVIGLRISNGCIYLVSNNQTWIALVILVFCETLALGLVLWKSVHHLRSMKGVEFSRSRPNLLVVMARDGIFYFICNLIITTTNLILLKRVSSDLRDFLFVTQGVVQNILCTRLLFHIKYINESPNATYISQWNFSSAAYSDTTASGESAEAKPSAPGGTRRQASVRFLETLPSVMSVPEA